MRYLLDTCIVSELMKPTPNDSATQWLSEQPQDDVFISVFTIGEIRRGILRMPISRRRDELVRLFDVEMMPKYHRQIVTWNVASAEMWAKIFADSERVGKTPSVIDSQIAATALSHGMTMVTRNVDDFQFAGLTVINPFEKEARP